MAKKPTVTIDKSKGEKKKSIYLGDYYSMKEMQPRPVTEGFLKVLAQKLIEWAELEDSLQIFEFQRLIGMRDKDYWTWRKRYPELQEAHEWAKRVIGARREVMACKRQLDVSMIKHTLYQYAPEYKEATEYHAKLARKEAEAVAGNMPFVVVPKIMTEGELEQYFNKEK